MSIRIEPVQFIQTVAQRFGPRSEPAPLMSQGLGPTLGGVLPGHRDRRFVLPSVGVGVSTVVQPPRTGEPRTGIGVRSAPSGKSCECSHGYYLVFSGQFGANSPPLESSHIFSQVQ